MRSSIPAATAGFLLLASSAPAPAQLPDAFGPTWSEIRSAWDGAYGRAGIPGGGTLAFFQGGRLLRHDVRGLADLASGRSVDEETIYHWASITKTFTAVSILQLRDRGLLSLDDPIVEWVPELREVHNPFGSMEDVTIRQLLSHSAGFRGATWPWGSGEPWEPYEPTEWSQLVAMMPYTRIEFAPGSRFSYSNPGIIFLGRVIEKASGDVFEAYVEKNVFRPLGMTHAYFDVTPWHLLPHRSNHYFLHEGEVREGGLDFNTGITVSNGGLNAPVSDMVRWFGFLLGEPPEGVDADVVLARSSLEEMWRAVVPIGDHELGRESMGLSFFLYQDGGSRLVGHTGTQRAFLSFFLLDPAAGVGVVAVSNGVGTTQQDPDVRAILDDTREAVAKRIFPLFRTARAAGSR